MVVYSEKYKHKSPFTCVVAGATMSGKSSFIAKYLENKNFLCEDAPNYVVLFYKEWQPIYTKLQSNNLVQEFHQNLPDTQTFLNIMNPRKHTGGTFCILDDIANEIHSKDVVSVEDIFTIHSHHLNICTFLVLHNFFHKNVRNITLNTLHIVLTNSPRDKTVLSYLARQCFPGTGKFLEQAYSNAVATNNYGYLIISLEPFRSDELRVATNIFLEDYPLKYYIPIKTSLNYSRSYKIMYLINEEEYQNCVNMLEKQPSDKKISNVVNISTVGSKTDKVCKSSHGSSCNKSSYSSCKEGGTHISNSNQNVSENSINNSRESNKNFSNDKFDEKKDNTTFDSDKNLVSPDSKPNNDGDQLNTRPTSNSSSPVNSIGTQTNSTRDAYTNTYTPSVNHAEVNTNNPITTNFGTNTDKVTSVDTSSGANLTKDYSEQSSQTVDKDENSKIPDHVLPNLTPKSIFSDIPLDTSNQNPSIFKDNTFAKFKNFKDNEFKFKKSKIKNKNPPYSKPKIPKAVVKIDNSTTNLPTEDEEMKRTKFKNTFKIRSKTSGEDRKRKSSIKVVKKIVPPKISRENRAVAYVDPYDNKAELKRSTSHDTYKKNKKKYPYWFS